MSVVSLTILSSSSGRMSRYCSISLYIDSESVFIEGGGGGVKQGGGGLVCIDREKNNTFTQLQKQHLATEILNLQPC